MYLVNVRAHYDAAHALRSYKGRPEPLHGHRFQVDVALATDALGEGGIAFDFVEIKTHLDELVAKLDHGNLNEIEPFDRLEPSAENQARWFFETLRDALPPEFGEAMVYARVWETPEQWAQYSEKSAQGLVAYSAPGPP